MPGGLPVVFRNKTSRTNKTEVTFLLSVYSFENTVSSSPSKQEAQLLLHIYPAGRHIARQIFCVHAQRIRTQSCGILRHQTKSSVQGERAQ